MRDQEERRWLTRCARGIETNDLPSNVAAPQQLDVAVQQDWDALKGNVKAPVDGVIMRGCNSQTTIQSLY